MSSVRKWALWRRVQYLVGFLLTAVVIGVVIFYTVIYVAPNCYDQMFNGNERGVDCGGDCVLICAADVIPTRVVWAESFLINDGQYNAVAYVENRNEQAGIVNLKYTFRLFSGDDLVGEREGVTPLPPNSIYPVFEGRIFIEPGTSVTRTEIIIDNPDYWQPSSVGRDQFRTLDINLTRSDEKPRLEVQLENTTLNTADAIEIVATIFNDAGEPVTASQTFVEEISARSTKDIIFTWPNPIAKTVRNCIIPTDITLAIDLSGSMNNDGDNPPEPISSTLLSASQLIGNLQAGDQVSIVSFASEAESQIGLTDNKAEVIDVVNNLVIDPEEETGFTNTPDALSLADTELSSVRHNLDARRVLVLLTDGLPTSDDEEDIIAETKTLASSINDNGVEIYAIGLGDNVDRDFIESVASTRENAYLAPQAADLSQIYSEITSSICEFGPTKIEVIAKTKANFTPIR